MTAHSLTKVHKDCSRLLYRIYKDRLSIIYQFCVYQRVKGYLHEYYPLISEDERNNYSLPEFSK